MNDLYQHRLYEGKNLYIIVEPDLANQLADDESFTPVSFRHELSGSIDEENMRKSYHDCAADNSNGDVFATIGFSNELTGPVIHEGTDEVIKKMEDSVEYADSINYVVITFFFKDVNDALAFKMRVDQI